MFRSFQHKLLPVTMTKPRSVYVLLSVLVGYVQYCRKMPAHHCSPVYITVIRCICAAKSPSC
jgi:hypothetical protein